MVSNLTQPGRNQPSWWQRVLPDWRQRVGHSRKAIFQLDLLRPGRGASPGNGNTVSFAALSAPEGSSLNSGHGQGLSLSWDEAGNPIPGIDHPRDLYWTLFANPNDSRKEFDARLRRKQSILDVVRLDGGALKRTLGKTDQEKLDEYFTGVRQIEQGLERQAAWADIPKPEAPFDEPGEKLTGEEEIKLMSDMIIIALQTDSTRVVTYRHPQHSLLRGMGIYVASAQPQPLRLLRTPDPGVPGTGQEVNRTPRLLSRSLEGSKGY